MKETICFNPKTLATSAIYNPRSVGTGAFQRTQSTREHRQPVQHLTRTHADSAGQQGAKTGGLLTCLTLVPCAVERRRDSPDHRLRVRLVHRPGRRIHQVGPKRARGGATAVCAGGRERAEQEELPAEGRGGGPHAAAVL